MKRRRTDGSMLWRKRLRPAHDLAHQPDRLFDHPGCDIKMGAGPDTAVHYGEQYAALVQGLDHVVTADVGAVRLEEDEVGFGLLHLHALDLRKPPRQRARIGVILREAIAVVVERAGV